LYNSYKPIKEYNAVVRLIIVFLSKFTIRSRYIKDLSNEQQSGIWKNETKI
jgi:hypothetical protein